MYPTGGAFSMLKTITNTEVLLRHANALKHKKFKPGFDNMSAEAAVMWLKINGELLCRQLRRGAYEPMPAKTFRIAKRNDGSRVLGKLTALDTVIQNAILEVLVPHCEKVFSPHSFAYREGRGLAGAVQQFCCCAKEHPMVVLLDPVSCFENIEHAILEPAIAKLLDDAKMCSLIMKCVRAPRLIEGELLRPVKGLLQGAPISNLLCNLYFSSLDAFLEEQNITFIRYADDIAIFASNVEQAQTYQEVATRYLEKELKLSPNTQKCQIDSPSNVSFLGYRFTADRYGYTAVAPTETTEPFYGSWHEQAPKNHHGMTHILTDGILRTKDDSIAFESEGIEKDIPIGTADCINLYSSVVFDSGFLEKAMANRVFVNIFDRKGSYIGRFVPNMSLHNPHIPHEQLLRYYDAKKRTELARCFVTAAIHNARLNIRYYHKQRQNTAYTLAVNRLAEFLKQVKQCNDYELLLTLEARAKEEYYKCFDLFVEGKGFCFKRRSRRPPRNELNAMINFGNVILYNQIATMIHQTALDIRIGFLHATNRRMESLNLDIAEGFKPLIVDRTVFSLVNLRSIRPEHFEKGTDGGVYLTQEGKKIFLKAFYDKLHTTIQVRNCSMSYKELIREDIYRLVRHFRSGEKFKAFTQVK